MSGTIKVLSYNTSWESSEPKPNWNENVNFYEPERSEAATLIASEADELGFDDEGNLTNREEQPDWKEKRAYTNTMLNPIDNEYGDGEDGISYHANKNPEEVRTNIFNIIKSGNYDLVGMQEYVHKIYDKNNYGKAIEDVYAQEHYIPSLSNMKLVIGDVPLNLPNGQIKTIEIGSLYNKNKFEQVGKKHYFDLGPDGRPVLIVLLKEKSSNSHILFINAHMPQGYNIKKLGEGKPDEVIANKINEEIKKMENQELIENARIILTTDSNDAKNEWIRNIIINGKKLNGGSNYKPTCCTTLIRKKNDRTREERRIRFGDIILDSQANENSFAYNYPKEIEGKAYSDHAPIEATLPPTQHNPPAPVSQGPKPPMPSQEKNEDNATSSGLFGGLFSGGKKKRRKRRRRTRKKKKRSRRKKRGGKKSRKKKRKRKTRRKRKN